MFIDTVYQQGPSLVVQTRPAEYESFATYQSFLNHERFYKDCCLSSIYSEKAAHNKVSCSHIKLNLSTYNHRLFNKNLEKRFHVFERDIMDSEAKKEKKKIEKKWKCPYCHYWWPIGQKCQNSKCPTKQW